MNRIRDTNGKWLDSGAFRTAAAHFMAHGYYCAEPWASQPWYDHWLEERRRCTEGHEVGGERITGEHYFYLNYCPIQRVEDATSNKSKKVRGFPDFWDGDYNYFWAREIARNGVTALVPDWDTVKVLPDTEQLPHLERALASLRLAVDIPSHTGEGKDGAFRHHLKGGHNLIVGKARRRGYSYKNAAVAACNYFTKPHSLTIFNAYEKKFLYPRGIMTMATAYVNHVNEHTGWTMPSDVVNKVDHVRSSYIQHREGVQYQRGFMSEILATSSKDNADANRGKDAVDILIEEAGAYGSPGLLKALYAASEDCVRAGAVQTGLITIFGTSGDMGGGTADYADMFQRPQAFNLLPFRNVWEERAENQEVGFFHPISWNLEGYYDAEGNSDAEGARARELADRKALVASGATTTEMQRRVQEKPLGPMEAFSGASGSIFPVAEVKRQLEIVKANGWQKSRGTPVELYYEEGEVVAKPILNGSVTPITSLHSIPNDRRGCPVIYEQPVESAPKGLYKMGYDPVRQDEGTSLAAMVVYKGHHPGTLTGNCIVAEYVGRLESTDDIDRMAMMLAEFYGTTIMYENEVPGTKSYFARHKRLGLLALQPDAVISKNVRKSRVARVYGCHMNGQLKDAGERYAKEWLLTVSDYDEHGKPVRVLDRIYSQRLLEELLAYDRRGNYDLVSALFMCMFQVQEAAIGAAPAQDRRHPTASKLLEMAGRMYAR